MYIFNILFLLSIGCSLVSSEQNTNSSTIYIFNYHSTVDNRTNLTTTDNIPSNIKLNFGNQPPADNGANKATTFQPVYTAILNLTELPSIKRMEAESFKPDFIAELPKEESRQYLTYTKDTKRDLPTSESATILINSMNNSRMLNSQKISHLISGEQTTNQSSNQATNRQSNQTNNEEKVNDGDMLKFEDELDIQPHSFSVASRLNVNTTNKSPETSKVVKEPSTTSRPAEEEESTGKKLKKKHLQMLQLKKKLRNNPDKFKAIKIRAPRLHMANATSKLFSERQARRHKIGYASLVRTRNVNLTDYQLDERHFIKKRIQNRNELDSSGSENRIRLIMIHSYKKPAAERFAKRIQINGAQENIGHQLIGAAGQTHHPIFVKLNGNRRLVNSGMDDSSIRGLAQTSSQQQPIQQLNTAGQLKNAATADQQSMFSATYQSSSNRYIPKLLLPRFTRPKMYSLNGFIPRPNVQKFTTTTTTSSLNVGPTQFRRNKSNRNSNDKKLDKHSNEDAGKRRKYKSKSSTNDLDEDDLNASGSATRKRQILFMKRKGFGYEEEANSLKPKQSTQEKKKNRKQWKAIDFQFPKANYPKELLESLNIRPEAPKPFEYPSIRKEIVKDGKMTKTYPTLAEIPKTSFQCPENLSSGVFADIETRCQAWHMCDKGSKHSFLCANGTVFNEKVGVCDHWYNVDCSPSNVKLTKLY